MADLYKKRDGQALKRASATMLRIYKQYYPIRNAFFIFGEGLFLILSVIFAHLLILRQGNDVFSAAPVYKTLLTILFASWCIAYTNIINIRLFNKKIIILESTDRVKKLSRLKISVVKSPTGQDYKHRRPMELPRKRGRLLYKVELSHSYTLLF